jgi:hypothetical protein
MDGNRRRKRTRILESARGSPVTAMIPYKGGVLAAFSNVGLDPNKYRIQFSADGTKIGEGEIRYDGGSPVTAMIPYKGGMLAAFSNVMLDPKRYRIQWSADGTKIGDGEVRYDGGSPVTAMILYR